MLMTFLFSLSDTVLSAPLNVTIRELGVNSAVVTWEILEGDPVIGFAITQQVPEHKDLFPTQGNQVKTCSDEFCSDGGIHSSV